MSVAAYREGPLYPRVARGAAGLLQRGKVVAPVDVLIGMGVLTPEHLEDWRRGKGPKQRLRFTKTGDSKVEEAYATHFEWPGGAFRATLKDGPE